MMNIKLLETETQMIHFIIYKILLLSFNSTYRRSVHIIASTEAIIMYNYIQISILLSSWYLLNNPAVLIKSDFSLALNQLTASLCIWTKRQTPLHRLQCSRHAHCLSPSHTTPTSSHHSPPRACLPSLILSLHTGLLSLFFVP